MLLVLWGSAAAGASGVGPASEICRYHRADEGSKGDAHGKRAGMTLETQEEFSPALLRLIDRWCDQRRLPALALLLPGYVGFNGMADGWEGLRAGLVSVRELGVEAVGESDWSVLGDLVRATDAALGER
jgi:hypothetical protein